MTRTAAWIAAAFTLALPGAAAADASLPPSEAEHLRQHAEIWKAEAKARVRWSSMSPYERRHALRRDRRATRRAYARAQASAGDASEVGSWAPPFVTATDYTGYAVHAAMLPTGKVLMWGREGFSAGHDTYAWLWDPAKGDGRSAFRDVTPTDATGAMIPIFCSGMSFLPDGKLLAVGGTLVASEDSVTDGFKDFAGLDSAVTFDPVSETWTVLPRPAGSEGRWYPTQVLLADGRTLVVSGYGDEAPGGVLIDSQEVYDPETESFTLLDEPAQRRATGLYPHLFTMPDGKVLLAGPEREDSAIFDPGTPADPWTNLAPLSSQRIGGNSVLLPEGPGGSTTVAAIGGSPWSGLPAAANEMVDVDDPEPGWSAFPHLQTPRWNANTLLLPDRSLVTIGGDDRIKGSPPAERAVELYDPVTGRWRVGPRQVETRGYHSTAVLLPDGRVLSTGDESHPIVNTPDGQSPDDTGEIYSPPYLFQGPRPSIRSAPDAVRWDAPFAVGKRGKVDDAVLIAPSAVTHANDMTQRLVPLVKVARRRGEVTLQSPPSSTVAPPGWYMLFVLADGVPSIAKWIQLDGAAADVPSTLSGPRLRIRFARDRWLGRLRRAGKLSLRVTLDKPATVNLRLLRGDRRVARVREQLGAGTHRVYLRPRRRTLRWLRRADNPRLRFSVVAVDAAEKDTVWTRVLRPPLRN
jgi:hypothetical protein